MPKMKRRFLINFAWATAATTACYHGWPFTSGVMFGIQATALSQAWMAWVESPDGRPVITGP